MVVYGFTKVSRIKELTKWKHNHKFLKQK
jgi:hypothetical protein